MVCFVSVCSVVSILLISLAIMAAEEEVGRHKNECNTLVRFVWEFVQDYSESSRH